MNELKEAYFWLKQTKVLVIMTLVLIVRNCCEKLFWPFTKTVNGYFQSVSSKRLFPEELKIARVTPIYQADDVNEIGNYRRISVLLCFSKILERIMFNWLFKNLNNK